MPDDLFDAVQEELARPRGGFYNPRHLAVGASEEIVVVSARKHSTNVKFPIKDKTGNSLGFTWRFELADGSVWDVNNRNRTDLLRGISREPTPGTVVFVPGRFRVTNLGASVNKQPSVKVEYLGEAAT